MCRLPALLVFLVACTGGKDPGEPELTECGVPTGSHSNPDYEFLPANFSCDSDPIDNAFDLNSGSFNTHAGLAAADVIADFEVGLDDWSSTGADLTLTEGSTTLSGGSVDDDGDHEIYMVDGPDPDDDGTDALATTFLWAVDDEAIDCDIEFYTERADTTAFNWVADATVTTGEHDLTWVMVHELGHCVGIDDQTAGSTVDDIMFGTYTAGDEYPGLQPDEEEAAKLIYGEL